VTLLAFAVSLLLSSGTVVLAGDARSAEYAVRVPVHRFSVSISVGVMVMALSLTMEIRHYRQRKTLSGIGRDEWNAMKWK
jgi:hypothetical protein